ncbi:30S ribosomal protein S11 [Candidatus Wolfebacteria bacterium]|nr:30S ribosomal protein S11 [Candidatus Wolfebacteria bacterium]
MGKKKVIKKTEEEIIKEGEAIKKETAKVATKGGGSKKIDAGKIFINATYNNTVITVTDKKGNVLFWVSAGSLGFSGPKKATPFAASKAVAALVDKMKKIGLNDLEIIVKGVGAGRDSAIRSFINQGFNVISVKDVTPIPHNGPRPPKVRRV